MCGVDGVGRDLEPLVSVVESGDLPSTPNHIIVKQCSKYKGCLSMGC